MDYELNRSELYAVIADRDGELAERDAEIARLRAENEKLKDDVKQGLSVIEDSFADHAELVRTLRAELEQARESFGRDLAHVAVDANNCEKRARKAELERAQARAADVEADILDAIEAVCELADAEHVRYREQWAGLRNSVIDDNAHDIGKVRQWLAERDIVRMGGKARDSRRTIAALVVAARAAAKVMRQIEASENEYTDTGLRLMDEWWAAVFDHNYPEFSESQMDTRQAGEG